MLRKYWGFCGKEGAVEKKKNAPELSFQVTGDGGISISQENGDLSKYLKHRRIYSREANRRKKFKEQNKRKRSRSKSQGDSNSCQVQAELCSRVRRSFLLP